MSFSLLKKEVDFYSMGGGGGGGGGGELFFIFLFLQSDTVINNLKRNSKELKGAR